LNTRSWTTGSRRNHRGDHDPVGGEPVILLSFIEDHLQRAHAEREHADAPVIDAALLPPDVGRIEDEQPRHDDRSQADRQINIEDPAPTEVVGEVAADDGAEHGGHHDAESPKRHRLAPVPGREGFQHHGLRKRLKRSAGSALRHAE
jgi:hypothetical protein